MRNFAFVTGSHRALPVALAVSLAALLAGCADSERLADPFGNGTYHSAAATDPMPTGSIPAAPAPVRPVQSSSLIAPATYTPAPAYAGATPAPVYPPPAKSHSGAVVAGWTAEGGLPIVVAQGETAGTVARRYGIPEAALLHANGFASAGQVRPGTRLIIPVYNAALAASSGARVASRPEPDHDREHPHVAKAANRAKAAERIREAKLEAKDKRLEEKRVEARPVRVEHASATKLDVPPKIEKVSLTPAPAVATKPVAEVVAPAAPRLEEKPGAAVASNAPEFRWPARGRIIHGFTGNDGIDIALPEGTPVKAAEAGVVAYAGNELKGYGNLILIRHPNGFVTAYANNGEIDVKRGEVVKRGQVIAKSGQTGNVTTPQLHFEVRKDAKPVDPVRYLANL